MDDYTVSSTSLEDVFLKINNKSTLNEIKYIKKDIINIIEEDNVEIKKKIINIKK